MPKKRYEYVPKESDRNKRYHVMTGMRTLYATNNRTEAMKRAAKEARRYSMVVVCIYDHLVDMAENAGVWVDGDRVQ